MIAGRTSPPWPLRKACPATHPIIHKYKWLDSRMPALEVFRGLVRCHQSTGEKAPSAACPRSHVLALVGFSHGSSVRSRVDPEADATGGGPETNTLRSRPAKHRAAERQLQRWTILIVTNNYILNYRMYSPPCTCMIDKISRAFFHITHCHVHVSWSASARKAA